MEGSPQVKTFSVHPFHAYLERQVPGRSHERKTEDVPNASLRLLDPGDLESLITKHQQWLDSDNYQKWIQASTEDKHRYVQGRVDLSRCDLRGVNLDNANLRDAVCWQSDFTGASLKHVNFERADLWGANFDSTNLYRAQLSHADAWDANFSEANLYGTYLNGVVMGGANFQKTQMVDAQLQQAYLGECNFQEADLRRSNFFRSDLREATFQGANLLDTNFRDTNVQRANFLKSSGLQDCRLAGAILSDSTFPEGSGAFRPGLRFLEATSQALTKGLFFLLLLTAYLILTLWSTTDAQFLTNSSMSGLPILHVGVPVTSFVLIFSALLLAVYFYWHLYADTIWRGVVQLPAIFPNGRTLDQELFPWIINGFIRPNVFHLKEMLSTVMHIQHLLLQLLIWWIVPFTLGLCWLTMLPLHNWNVTNLQIVFVVLAVGGAFIFQLRSKTILRGDLHGDPAQHIEILSTHNWWKPVVRGVMTCCIAVIVSDGAINGMPLKKKALVIESPVQQMELVKHELAARVQSDGYGAIHRTLVPLALPLTGMHAFAEVSNLDLSERSSTRFGQGENRPSLDLVKGAQLMGANLRHLSGAHVFLKKANLQTADLNHAILTSADLESANLLRANLQSVDLRGANLKHANLFEANLQEAQLTDAVLHQANFFEANLSKADLVGAKLQRSTFVGANLQGAVLNGADLSQANMGTVNMSRASLQAANLAQVNLFEANLTHASFYGATVGQVNLEGATLQQTNFRGVDLSSAKHLTQGQLNQACINSTTKLPKKLTRPKPCQR